MAITWSEELRNNTNVTAALTNYPALFTEACLAAGTKAQWFTEAGTNGENVQAYLDSGFVTQLAMELVAWDSTAQTFEIWVKYPTLGVTLNKIYLAVEPTQIAQPAVTSLYGRNAVYINYLAYYHLGHGGVNAQGNATKDLTIYNNPTVITGRNGKALRFNGTTQYAQSGAVFNTESQYAVGVGYSRPGVISNHGRLFEIGGWSSNAGGLSAEGNGGATWNYILWTVANGYNISLRSMPAINTWTDLNMGNDTTINSTKYYENGFNFLTNTAWNRTNLNATSLTIGRQNSAAGNFVAADVDYFYVYNGIPTQSWVTAEYNNHSNPGIFWAGQGGIASGTPLTVTASTTSLSLAASASVISANVDLTVTASTTSLSLAASSSASITANKDLSVSVGNQALNLTKTPVVVDTNLDLSVSVGSQILSLLKNTVSVTVDKDFVASVSSQPLVIPSINPSSITANKDLFLTSLSAVLSINNLATASLAKDVDLSVSVGSQSLSLAGNTSTIDTNLDLSASVSSQPLVISTSNTFISTGVDLSVSVGSQILSIASSNPASVTKDVDLNFTTSTSQPLVIPSINPVSLTKDVDLSVATSEQVLSLSVNNPSVATGADKIISVDPGPSLSILTATLSSLSLDLEISSVSDSINLSASSVGLSKNKNIATTSASSLIFINNVVDISNGLDVVASTATPLILSLNNVVGLLLNKEIQAASSFLNLASTSPAALSLISDNILSNNSVKWESSKQRIEFIVVRNI